MNGLILIVDDERVSDGRGDHRPAGAGPRRVAHAVPLVMMTAKAAEIDRVVGFEVGADDYVTKYEARIADLQARSSS